MSYPNQNPYGPPPGQQPGYGYPQQQPPQPSPYGPPYPGAGMPGMGMPGAPVLNGMPGGVKAARVMLFVLAGMNLLGLIGAVAGLSAVSKASKHATYATDDDLAAFSVGKGLLITLIVLIVVFTVLAITAASQFGKGGTGVRTTTIIFGVANTLASFVVFPLGLVHTVLGILIIVFVSKDEGQAWFNRPRY
ncbi:hypothetical protein [Streptomyces chattanoogensis]|uniref:Integral membrane protein n=1 Tax=Streptomyces chattanoogensis TaxID=66876 RepID=A0A0N0GVG6_9ACTN|nr:hypothetical protein [Streptomyces chattanoogensis]KPC59291.1 integral membrane protein [Streptomyces chattanoogensis]